MLLKRKNKMKKFFGLFIIALSISCGGEKKEEVISEKEVEISKRSIVIDAVYEKDDELSFVYMKDGFWNYDNPQKHKITGSSTPQTIEVILPSDYNVENIEFDLSSNREQKLVKITSIKVLENGKTLVDGSNMAFIKYFNAGTGLSWDEPTMSYKLSFDGEFPPRMQGNEQLESILVK